MITVAYEEKKKKVYEVVRQIPRGKTMSYKEVARLSGIKNPRLVGKILHENTDPVNIPCHRVIRSDGTIADGYAFGGKKAQKKKLREEGVKI
jgi:methylated-DNA-protein-cysteine methyltransferase-like protein